MAQASSGCPPGTGQGVSDAGEDRRTRDQHKSDQIHHVGGVGDIEFGLLADRLAQHLDPHENPATKLHAFVREFVAFSARHPDLLRVIHQEGSSPSRRLSYLLDTYVRPIIAGLAPTYATLVESGRARPVPPEAFYYLVTSGGDAKYALDGMTGELFGATVLEPEQIDDYAQTIADLVVRGIGNSSQDP